MRPNRFYCLQCQVYFVSVSQVTAVQSGRSIYLTCPNCESDLFRTEYGASIVLTGPEYEQLKSQGVISIDLKDDRVIEYIFSMEILDQGAGDEQ